MGVMRLRYIVDNNLMVTEASHRPTFHSIRLSVRTVAFQAIKSSSTLLSSTNPLGSLLMRSDPKL